MSASLIATGSDLSAELILNKIMNNQVKTSTGKTITAAGRSVAAELTSAGYAAGAAAGNVASGQGYVLAAQTQVTEMVSKLQEMQNMIGGMASGNSTTYKNIGASAKDLLDYISSLSQAKLNGKNLLSGSGLTLTAGMGVSITIINKTVSTGTGKLKNLTSVLGNTLTSATDATAALTAIDEALRELNGYIADYGISYKQLRDRVAVLNDLGQGFNEAAAAQSITATGGASDLLAAMLGGNSTA